MGVPGSQLRYGSRLFQTEAPSAPGPISTNRSRRCSISSRWRCGRIRRAAFPTCWEYQLADDFRFPRCQRAAPLPVALLPELQSKEYRRSVSRSASGTWRSSTTLLNRMKSYKDHNGTFLDQFYRALFGSGHGTFRQPHRPADPHVVLAGNGGGRLKTGRYLRYSKNQDLSRLHLALMQQFGVDIESYGGATEPLPGSGRRAVRGSIGNGPFKSWTQGGRQKVNGPGKTANVRKPG